MPTFKKRLAVSILEFANPIGFWWALIAIPIIGLYILKVRLRRVPVTTLLFWNQLYDEKKPRSWWQQLRHWLSLLLQLAFLLLLVAALVDPLWSWQRQNQRRIVMVLDNSASMQAVGSDGTARLELAKQSAVAMVRSLRDGDQMALVSAGGQPKVVWGMTNHQSWLIDAIQALPATDAPSAIEPSVKLARRLLSGLDGEGETIVLTDGQSHDLEPLLDDENVSLYGVGEPQHNLGITRYQVRRSLMDAIGYQVLVDVSNFSDNRAACRLELDLEDELVDVLPLELEPNETVTRIVNHTSASGGRMIAKLDIDDGLAVDNMAVALLPTRRPIPITLVSEGGLFVPSVLSSIPLVELTVVSELAGNTATAASIHVFHRSVPHSLPTGPVLVIDPQEDCELWSVAEDIEQPIVAAVDSDSALTQHVRLDNVLFPGAKQLEFSAEAQGLIRDPFDAPFLARIARPGGDVVVLTCNLDQGDLPLRIAFPVLMKNTIEWFQGNSGLLRPAASCGEMVTLDLDGSPSQAESSPGDAMESADGAALVRAGSQESRTSFELVAPDGAATPITARGGRATIGPLLNTGLWLVRPVVDPLASSKTAKENSNDDLVPPAEMLSAGYPLADESVIGIACNLASFEEGDLRPRYELARPSDDLAVMLLGGRSLWFYLTLAAVGLIATEWWLYHRRIVG